MKLNDFKYITVWWFYPLFYVILSIILQMNGHSFSEHSIGFVDSLYFIPNGLLFIFVHFFPFIQYNEAYINIVLSLPLIFNFFHILTWIAVIFKRYKQNILMIKTMLFLLLLNFLPLYGYNKEYTDKKYKN